jgi:uncharacterized protein
LGSVGIEVSEEKHVIVVGAGISGLVAAWLIGKHHRVTILEKEPRIGGHTNTVVIPSGVDAGTPVDTGFIVCNDQTYPTFHAFREALGVPWRWSDMSFGFECERSGLQYSGRGVAGLFAQKWRAFSPRYIRFLSEIRSFCSNALRDLTNDSVAIDESLGSYLERYRYSADLRDNYILPMGAAIWSTPAQGMLDFPVHSFLRFCKHHGLLSIKNRPRWQTIIGGSHQYLKAFESKWATQTGGKGIIRCNSGVVSITRSLEGVTVMLTDGSTIHGTDLVMAVHSDEVLPLLESPSSAEHELFSPFRYQANIALLHSDTRMLPSRAAAQASWNYRREVSAHGDESLSVTYDMNRLQGLSASNHYLVTLNSSAKIDERKLIKEIRYTHPLYTVEALQSQLRIPQVQGNERTWFCGAYCGWGFHEDGAKSGLEVAKSLLQVPELSFA